MMPSSVLVLRSIITGMGQTLLFPDPRPLDERLGLKFFRRAPRRPGVYLMKDAADRVLYVGKANDLKRRLNSYRVANPDRMPRRHLRLVREVARIEFQFCPGESAALRRESKLLRSLRPRFNRAGVWPGKPRFMVWRAAGEIVELGVVEIPGTGWRRFGPLNAGAGALHQSLSRLLWLALHPRSGINELPAGWWQGRLREPVAIPCGDQVAEILAALEKFFWEGPAEIVAWFGPRLCGRTHPFERAVIIADLEQLQNFPRMRNERKPSGGQLALL
jgi:predicted GIY-YIG superfamily endonuclease